MSELAGPGGCGAGSSSSSVAAQNQVPEIAASAVLVPSEELPVGSDVVKVKLLNWPTLRSRMLRLKMLHP